MLNQAIEVPETLLKKRKQNEKAREERLIAATAARKVSKLQIYTHLSFSLQYDAYDTIDEWLAVLSTLLCCLSINHLSGLILFLQI